MKQAIAAILTDTHLKEDNREIVKAIFRQAVQIIKPLGLKQLEHAGDIFDSRKAQLQINLTAYTQVLNELHDSGIELNQVIGNHDKTEYSIVESFIDPYEHHPALNLYRYGGGRPLAKDIFLTYASYFTDEVYTTNLHSLHEHGGRLKKNVLLTHIGVTGAMMNSGIIVESEIGIDLFEPYDLVLIGHYHDSQNLDGGRIRYVGASLQHNFGELMGKGLTILYDDLTTETVPLKYPQFIKYEVAPGDITKKDIDDLKKEKQESGDNIRVVLIGTDAEVKSFNKQILMDAGLSVQHKTDDINKEELEQRLEAFDLSSLNDEFKIFCEKNKLDVFEGMRYFKHILVS